MTWHLLSVLLLKGITLKRFHVFEIHELKIKIPVPLQQREFTTHYSSSSKIVVSIDLTRDCI